MEKCFKTRFSMQKRTRQRSINIPLSPNEDLEQGEEREREREREREGEMPVGILGCSFFRTPWACATWKVRVFQP